MSIRYKIFVVIVLMSVFIILAGIGTGLVFTVKNITETIRNDMTVVANTADRLITSEINLLKANTSIAAKYLVEARPEDFHKVLDSQVKIYEGIKALTVLEPGRVVDEEGSPMFHSDFINAAYIRKAFEGERVISSTRRDPVSGKLVFHVCVPLRVNDGKVERILIATIDGMYFNNVLKNLTIWETGYIFINDGEGYVLANPRRQWVQGRFNFIFMARQDPQYEAIAHTVSKMVRGESGVDQFFVENVEQLCTYKPISGSQLGWSLGVMAPVRESPLQSTRDGLLLVGLVSFALCFIAAFIASSVLAKPYKAISGMVEKLKRQDALLRTINDAAEVLLGSETSRFDLDLQDCMGLMTRCVRADRMRIYKNYTQDGDERCTLVYEWPEGARGELVSITLRYGVDAPRLREKLSNRKCVNGPAYSFPEAEQALLASHNILSILIVPVFFHNSFWGFVTFEDCRLERSFSCDEESIMVSGAFLVVNALQRNEMEKDLIRAHEEALASAEAKTNFLANMSHEMRTPLNAIIGLSELSLDSGRAHSGPEDYENLEKIYTSGITLLGLINDILDLSKIESGKFEIIPIEYDMPSLINDTVMLNSVRIGSKPIEFFLHIDESLPSKLKGDDLRIKQMFNNLLSNAFKYTKEGRVDWTVYCERDGEDLWLVSQVKDTGIGIRPADVQKLFSDYNQVDTKSNRKIEGTGLGLSITKKMAEMMGGKISVESEYGAGSVFTVRIRQESVTDTPIGKNVAERLQDFRYSEHKRDRSAKLLRAHIPYARVLVVDDVGTNLDVAKGLLKPYGMQVDCVTSGPAAIKLLREEKIKYNAVFMDHMMPGMDGIEAARVIREEIGTEYAKTIPIIALTANAIVGNEEIFLKKGFQEFLSKPIDILALDIAVNRWVRDKEREKELAEQPDFPPELERRGSMERRKGLDRRETGPLMIPGLNMTKGIANFAGDRKTYWEVLKSYSLNTPPLLDKIRSWEKEDLGAYAVVVHGIKSSSRSIGAEELGTKAEALEHAAKAGDYTFVAQQHPAFIKETEGLLADLCEALRLREAQNPKPLMNAPDAAVLAALREACLKFDINEVDNAVEKLELYTYASQADLVPWIRERLNSMDFEQIAERLADLSAPVGV
jgi:signal transduction histidine kinase/FixJ family two-component response regulator/HPt (histidine-containing phosphotransfer) domain-containing protein